MIQNDLVFFGYAKAPNQVTLNALNLLASLLISKKKKKNWNSKNKLILLKMLEIVSNF